MGLWVKSEERRTRAFRPRFARRPMGGTTPKEAVSHQMTGAGMTLSSDGTPSDS